VIEKEAGEVAERSVSVPPLHRWLNLSSKSNSTFCEHIEDLLNFFMYQVMIANLIMTSRAGRPAVEQRGINAKKRLANLGRKESTAAWLLQVVNKVGEPGSVRKGLGKGG
jgi:hypothetical protein